MMLITPLPFWLDILQLCMVYQSEKDYGRDLRNVPHVSVPSLWKGANIITTVKTSQSELCNSAVTYHAVPNNRVIDCGSSLAK